MIANKLFFVYMCSAANGESITLFKYTLDISETTLIPVLLFAMQQ